MSTDKVHVIQLMSLQDDVTDAPNDVTATTSGGNNSRALSEAFYSL